ncbi:MAG: OmpA family protein [Archangiaceae bacterium]|nr:OmpA family protein [Archangiaceae bacterium]
MIRLMAVLILVAATGCAKKVHPYYLDEPADPTGEGQKLKDTAALEKLLTDSTLHFGFDEASLTEADRTMLEKVAFALRSRPTITIRIAGHADERGTEEYNLALGQRRAEVARKFLLALGVTPEQVETLTFGEEKPAVNESNEEAWAWNRRDELGIRPVQLVGWIEPAVPAEELK